MCRGGDVREGMHRGELGIPRNIDGATKAGDGRPRVAEGYAKPHPFTWALATR